MCIGPREPLKRSTTAPAAFPLTELTGKLASAHRFQVDSGFSGEMTDRERLHLKSSLSGLSLNPGTTVWGSSVFFCRMGMLGFLMSASVREL